MRTRHGVAFATFTTLRVGGPAAELVEVADRNELFDAFASANTQGCLAVGGGSNLVVSDEGVDRTVVAIGTKGVDVDVGVEGVRVVASAGEEWDAFVERCVSDGWAGVEALSGIPGLVGATPVQNVGAYGQEVSDVITRVEVLDRTTQEVRSLTPTECGFGYRTSQFKREPERFVILDVEFSLQSSGLGAPVGYAELARHLGVELGTRVPIGEARQAVIELRRSKGMVLDDRDHDTWSAGSFFTNPVLAPADVPDGAPSWPLDGDRAKVSAAWLIERAGFDKGFGVDVGTGRARLSTKHALAITNVGGATTADVVLLARTVRQGVEDQFGVRLLPEPTLVGVEL